MTLLTVAIPTYNGAKTIKVSLEKLILVKNKFPIEVIVSDNNSTDNTAAIVKSFKEVKYYKNNRNEGFNYNCHLCVKRSEGHYVWLLSDNDTFNINCFKNIYYFLSKNKDLVTLFLNYSAITNKMNEAHRTAA